MKTQYPSRVLAVDDDPSARQALAVALGRFGHDVDIAGDAGEAEGKLREDVSLVILDAQMPGRDGFDLARRVRSEPEWSDIPILMVTGRDSHDDRLRAVEAGVSDFLPKPWEVVELHLRSEALLRVKSSMDAVKRERAGLEAEVARRTADLRRTMEDLSAAHRHTHQAHLDTIRSLVHAAEFKDVDTAAHIDRIRWYADLIARGMGLAPHDVELLREASPMHDVGKIGIPDAVLLKPGPLTPAERLVMQRHTEIGARILGESSAEVLRMGRVIALSHHERWDGHGYPNRLSGPEIPLAGRICAVADVFDALSMDRCYRPALSNGEVVAHMEAGRGSHFDPAVLDVFLDVFPEVERIQAAHRDGASEACAA
jgi:putative two-component system response regulator